MRWARLCARATGTVLLMALLGAACARGDVVVITSSSSANGVPPGVPRLSTEIEAKLATFLDKAKVEKAKVWDARMTKEIADVVQVTGLDAGHAQTLEQPAKQAVAASLDGWTAKLGDLFRTGFARMTPEQVTQTLDQGAQMAGVAQATWPGVTEPFEQADWIKAIHQVLTPDQAAAWDKAQAARKTEFEKTISDALNRSGDRVHEQQLQEIQSVSRGIESALNLPKERSDKLEALAKNVADQTTEMWKKRVETMLLSMGDAQRHAFTANGNMSFGIDPDEYPSKQPAWTQGVASLLTAAEKKSLDDAGNARREKRMQVMGRIMLELLDEKIAFSEAQRQKLEPLAVRLVKTVPNLSQENGPGMYYAYPTDSFFAAAATAPDAELKPVLDDIQLNHWHELSKHLSTTTTVPDSNKANPDDREEPEDVEKAISAYLYAKAEEERKQSMEENVLKVEDAVRTAKLGQAATARLEAAARGAAEESLASWKWFVEQQIRGQLQGNVTPQNIRQRLESFQAFIFQRNIGMNQGARPVIWDAAVKSELSAPQRDLWKKETDARSAFQDNAIAALALSQFDGKYQLTDDQWQKLQPIIAGIVHGCSPDIEQMFSGNTAPWYLMGQFQLMPFAGVSDTDLKAILTKDQLARWTGSQNCMNATSWWGNVRQIHQQRAQMINIR
jgi:hypothetical protein